MMATIGGRDPLLAHLGKTYNRIPVVGLVDDETLGEWMADAVARRRAASAKAAEYEYRKPRIQRGVERHLAKNGNTATDYDIRKSMEANWDLIDMSRMHAWLRDEADSLNLAIQTQLALRAAIAQQEAKP